ncbi:MAG: Transcriptional regulator, TetR family protein [Myxococcaceae bacterium]|jgi:AcrR family transcriptional regulator|nr:Transcriptional regulator, TetR family protein [Myxococcaceae bacterium]
MPHVCQDTALTLPARRIPLQERSQRRVERILAAAAELFVEMGYDATTTEAIAERAGTSIGSLYQFFPNKLALFDAISTQYLEGSKKLYDELLTPEAVDTPWESLLDRMLDAFADFHRTSVAFRAVWVNWKLSPEFIAAGEMLNQEFARRIELVLAKQAKNLAKKDRAVVATMLVEITSAMLLVAVRRDKETGDRLLAETKIMIRRYLAPYAKAKRKT